MPHRVDFQVAQAKHGFLGGGLAAPQEHAYARQQFREFERLDQIVVSSEIESTHLVASLSACREHEDRRLLGSTKRRENGVAVDARQHDVQHDQVVIPSERRMQAVCAVKRQFHGVAAFDQALAQVVRRPCLVLD